MANPAARQRALFSYARNQIDGQVRSGEEESSGEEDSKLAGLIVNFSDSDDLSRLIVLQRDVS